MLCKAATEYGQLTDQVIEKSRFIPGNSEVNFKRRIKAKFFKYIKDVYMRMVSRPARRNQAGNTHWQRSANPSLSAKLLDLSTGDRGTALVLPSALETRKAIWDSTVSSNRMFFFFRTSTNI